MPLLTIEVTQDDIAQGIAEDCRRCPIARAIQRVTGFPADVEVGRVWLEPGGRRPDIRTVLPDVASRFVHEFDNGRAVHPFSFSLDVDLEGGTDA